MEYLNDNVIQGAARVPRHPHRAHRLQRWASLPGIWHDQEQAEWVVLLRGFPGLLLEGEDVPPIPRPGQLRGDPRAEDAHGRGNRPHSTVWVAVHASSIVRDVREERHSRTPRATSSLSIWQRGCRRAAFRNIARHRPDIQPRAAICDKGYASKARRAVLRAGSGCLNSVPRKLSGFLPGYAECGVLRF